MAMIAIKCRQQVTSLSLKSIILAQFQNNNLCPGIKIIKQPNYKNIHSMTAQMQWHISQESQLCVNCMCVHHSELHMFENHYPPPIQVPDCSVFKHVL